MCDETRRPAASSRAGGAAACAPSPSTRSNYLPTKEAKIQDDEEDTDDEDPYEDAPDAPLELVYHDWAQLSWYYPAAIMSYRNVEPMLQTGNVQCGFVAAAMAASVVGRNPNVQEMFAWACQQGLTNIGDMFDIANLKTLCDKYVGTPSAVMEFPAKTSLIADLIRGKLFLVPYDAGYDDGAPALYNGHKAHWALLFGVLLMRPECYPCTDGLYRLSANRPIYRGSPEFYEAHMDNGLEFVLAQHGWYSDPDKWSVEELRESCWQLNEVDPKGAPAYVLPPGGIREGLRGKVLRLDV